MWRYFENSRTVNCQTRFLCSRLAISEVTCTSQWQLLSKFLCSLSLRVIDGAKTHNLALERLISYRFVRILLSIDC